jgi:two-component system, OmpR family, phosphate regulon sensor histidine kinase PhoR
MAIIRFQKGCSFVKMKSKNALIILLMASSILLLLVLQIFWLTSSYEKAYVDLRKETNNLFESTIGALRDSLFVKNFERVSQDTTARSTSFIFNTEKDTSFVLNRTSKKERSRTASQIQIFISSTDKKDSLQRFLRPIGAQIQRAKIETGNFILHVGPDSLSRDSIRITFQRALKKENLSFRFEIGKRSVPEMEHSFGNPRARFKALFERVESDEESRSVFSDTIKSRWVRFNPINLYNVQISDGRSYLLKGIAPQVLFSVFLTTLTLGAFWIMYRSIRSQQRLGELKNDFISNMTHELKTPITTVGVAIEALRDFKGIENPELTKEYLEIAQNELNRLALLTDKILKTSLFESKGVDFQPEPVHLDQVIEQVIASMKLVLEKRNGSIKFEKTGSDFELQGSLVHLTNVVYNLLDNALKYTDRSPTINISLVETGREIRLVVEDNGIGISSEFKKRVFEKFFRVPAGDIHTNKGYGLGLSYVDSVVKAHKATIALDSEIGKGSTFIIKFKR